MRLMYMLSMWEFSEAVEGGLVVGFLQLCFDDGRCGIGINRDAPKSGEASQLWEWQAVEGQQSTLATDVEGPQTCSGPAAAFGDRVPVLLQFFAQAAFLATVGRVKFPIVAGANFTPAVEGVKLYHPADFDFDCVL